MSLVLPDEQKFRNLGEVMSRLLSLGLSQGLGRLGDRILSKFSVSFWVWVFWDWV